ncbi:hypothetical protein AMECASPLE_039002 [Ameca splendens]|uniref:Immunoglobulin domain-containing protein n=1 Tax=Ameca splendens TaxID=208324 RepID=A0ABV1AER2_9TELE
MCLNSTMRILFTATVWWLTVGGSSPLVEGKNKEPLNTACNGTRVDQTAHVGESVSITCKYPQADKSSIRYFCRHAGNFTCTNIISAQHYNYTKLPRFSLTDDKQQGAYTVLIFTLTQEDAGKYQCALKTHNSITCLQDVLLHVLSEY